MSAPDRASGERESSLVVLEVGSDLQLDLPEAVRDGLAGEPLQLLVAVAQPARPGGVCGEAGLEQVLLACIRTLLPAAQDVERLIAGERIAEVAQVDQVDELFRREGCEVLPERQPRPLGAQVPERVDDGSDRHVDDALLGSEPAQLGVVQHLAPGGAHIRQEFFDVTTHETRCEHVDGVRFDVVAASDREHEARPGQAVITVGLHLQVGGRVVGVRVHRIRPVEEDRRREADIERADTGDGAQWFSSGAARHGGWDGQLVTGARTAERWRRARRSSSTPPPS